MSYIVVNTTFRDFEGKRNDKMQIGFLKSLKRQTFQDFILVVSIFNEKCVEKNVRDILGDKSFFIYDSCDGNYKFSLTKTFKNGIDFGLESCAKILLDCSSDIILQKNFLEVIARRCKKCSAGISHPNIFIDYTEMGKKQYIYGRISQGIDARFFSLDMFRREEIYKLLDKFPSYDYGYGIEVILCGIAIKYADHRSNIFEESKVLKTENDRGGRTKVINSFMREGYRRNISTIYRFMEYIGLDRKYSNIIELNSKYKVTHRRLSYLSKFMPQYVKYFQEKRSY